MYVGTPPIVEIIEPQNGVCLPLGTTFYLLIIDAEDQSTDLAVSWDASLVGELRSGYPDSQGVHQFAYNTLPAGLHTITLSTTDSTGLNGSDTITVLINTPPTAPMVSVLPDPAYGSSMLTATASGSTDADGDPVSYSYEWYENGMMHSTGTTVGSTDLDVGEVWTIRVTPDDGYTVGAYTEVSVTISNSDPTLTTPMSVLVVVYTMIRY